MTWTNLDAAAEAACDAYLDIVAASLPDEVRAVLRFPRLDEDRKENWREFARRVLRASQTTEETP